MTKTKASKKAKKSAPKDESEIPPEALASIKLGNNKDYQEYVKEHNRRMRELDRIASGRNMREPW